LPEGITALAKSGLMYRWTFRCEMKGGPCPAIYERHIFPRWKPILWYVKGNCDDLEWTDDVIEGVITMTGVMTTGVNQKPNFKRS
jgi:hypothetical protein